MFVLDDEVDDGLVFDVVVEFGLDFFLFNLK